MNASEETLFKEKNIDIVPYIFAQDALAIIVNPYAKIDSFSVDQVRQIFKGDIGGVQAAPYAQPGLGLRYRTGQHDKQQNNGNDYIGIFHFYKIIHFKDW